MRTFLLSCASASMCFAGAALAAEGPSLSIGANRVAIGTHRDAVVQAILSSHANETVEGSNRNLLSVLGSDKQLLGTIAFKDDKVIAVTSNHVVQDASALLELLHSRMTQVPANQGPFVASTKKQADMNVVSLANERVSIEIHSVPTVQSAPIRDRPPEGRVQVRIMMR
jgi:hypothetical protein